MRGKKTETAAVTSYLIKKIDSDLWKKVRITCANRGIRVKDFIEDAIRKNVD